MTRRTYIFWGLWLVLSMTGCRAQNGANFEEAGFVIPETKQRIVVKRNRSHKTLPEYTRVLELWIDDQKKVTYEMFPDTGGTVRIDVRRNEDAVYLTDRISTYKIDFKLSKITEEDKADGVLLGIIDEAEAGGWRFIEASREEKSKR